MIAPLSLDAGGSVAEALRVRGRTFSPRSVQMEYASLVERAFRSGRPGFIDAETGVGKTMGYLAPALERLASMREGARGRDEPRPVLVVSTATVALQRQILEEDAPVALDALRVAGGPELAAALRVGRAQVVDLAALEEAIDRHALPEEADLADDAAAWVMAQVARDALPLHSDLCEALADRIDRIPPWLARTVVGLRGDPVSAHGETLALYAGMVERASGADLLVVNHHLLALHLTRAFLWGEGRRAVVVVDEADRLPGAVDAINRAQVPLRSVQSLLEAADAAATVGREPALAARAAVAVSMRVLEDAWPGPGGGVLSMARLGVRERLDVLQAMEELEDEIGVAVERMRKAGDDRPVEAREREDDLDRYRSSIGKVMGVLEEGDAGRALLYYTPVRRYPGLALDESGRSRRIAYRLWGDGSGVDALLFTSATLSSLAQGEDTNPRRAISAFAIACGFRAADVRHEDCALLSPERFGSMRFVRPAIDAPAVFETGEDEEPRLRPEALAYWRRMILEAAEAGGRVLVLVPSHRDVRALDGLHSDLGGRLVLQRPGVQTAAARARFLARPDTVWVSASVWEGLSLPGAISQIVIPRLPIRPPLLDDRLIEAYWENRRGQEARGRALVFAARMAEARRRLRQGIGRGIRSADDDVTVWIGDGRWPLSQRELDEALLDQPATWSSAMRNAVPVRFRRALDESPRLA